MAEPFRRLTVNMVSESDISVQGHGVHTAYIEMAQALEGTEGIRLIRGEFGKQVDCDIVHLHSMGPRTWRKLLQRGPKKVVSAHVVPASFVGSIRLAKYWSPLARWYMSWYYKKADVVLAVSGMVATILHDELGVAKDKIQVFYNSIDMRRYTPTSTSQKEARDLLKIDESAYVVLGNGQVQPRKRLDTFIAMALALPEVKFIWVGGIPFKQLGAEYGAMKQLMNNVPDNMIVTGVIPHDEVKMYYHAADVFCLPAEQENHPMCVLEAASAELPIVLRDIPEYADSFQANVLYCQSDESFIETIQQLSSESQRAQWRTQTALIAKRFDSMEAAKRLRSLYQSLV